MKNLEIEQKFPSIVKIQENGENETYQQKTGSEFKHLLLTASKSI